MGLIPKQVGAGPMMSGTLEVQVASLTSGQTTASLTIKVLSITKGAVCGISLMRRQAGRRELKGGNLSTP